MICRNQFYKHCHDSASCQKACLWVAKYRALLIFHWMSISQQGKHSLIKARSNIRLLPLITLMNDFNPCCEQWLNLRIHGHIRDKTMMTSSKEAFAALLALCEGNQLATGGSPHKGQWRWILMFSLKCAWTNGWVNSRDAGDLRRHRAHYDAFDFIGCDLILASVKSIIRPPWILAKLLEYSLFLLYVIYAWKRQINEKSIFTKPILAHHIKSPVNAAVDSTCNNPLLYHRLSTT